MAVSFKTKDDYGYDLLDLFKVSAPISQAAKAGGVKIEMSSPGTLVIKSASGAVVTSVPVKAQAISMAKTGSLGPASLQAVTSLFVGAIQKALDTKFTDAEVNQPAASNPAKLGTSPVNLFANKVVVGGEDLLGQKAKPTGTNEQAVSAPTVAPGVIPPGVFPLDTASKMFQPVKGTSASSIYYVVALLKGLNLAVRSTSGSISVRAAGPALNNYGKALEEAGFDVKSNYASVHFDCHGEDIKVKTIGAILAKLGLHNVLQLGNLVTVLGK